MADMVTLLTVPIMVIQLTCTDPMEITAWEHIMDGAAVITEASVGVAVMVGTAMAEVDTDGVEDMVTTGTDISGTGIGSVFVALLV